MKHEIISRAEAKAKGLKSYFTGKPCKNGIIAERRVSNHACLCEKCKAENLARAATWHENNPERVSEIKKRWAKNNKEKCSAISKGWQKKNHDKYRDSQRRHRENNKMIFMERTRAWRERNPEQVVEYSRRYRKDNKENVLANNAKRHSARMRAVPAWFSELDEFMVQQAYELAAEREASTGIEWHVDHMIPLRAKKACGLHCADNIQVIPAVMNLSKNNKMALTEPLEWLR